VFLLLGGSGVLWLGVSGGGNASIDPQHLTAKGDTVKTRTSIALAVIAGFGFGAVSIHTLHAQAKPPVFVIAEIEVSNADAYLKEYAPNAQALIRKNGGRSLAASMNVAAIDGSAPKRVSVQQWESMEKVKAHYASPAYKENRKVGDKYAKFRIFAVEGMPQP
jgi:uncharacterized protein (DUF1330 family)